MTLLQTSGYRKRPGSSAKDISSVFWHCPQLIWYLQWFCTSVSHANPIMSMCTYRTLTAACGTVNCVYMQMQKYKRRAIRSRHAGARTARTTYFLSYHGICLRETYLILAGTQHHGACCTWAVLRIRSAAGTWGRPGLWQHFTRHFALLTPICCY